LSDNTPDSKPTKTASVPLLVGTVFGFGVMTAFAIAGAMDGRNGSRPAFVVAAVSGGAMVLVGLVAIVKVSRQK